MLSVDKVSYQADLDYYVCAVLGGRFVNLKGESKNFKMLEVSLKQLQSYYGHLCDLLIFM
jgi:hypothetical protein